ncbi:MAG: hypothetical protein H8D67_23820 [Deltaproteobacteria bacterium]|nr:hypothetical protein [Deltaproteobacteria bacterium]
MRQQLFKNIASDIQLFKNVEEKERFLFVLGALITKIISLQKACEIMEIDREFFMKLLDLMSIEFSYLSVDDVEIEKSW